MFVLTLQTLHFPGHSCKAPLPLQESVAHNELSGTPLHTAVGFEVVGLMVGVVVGDGVGDVEGASVGGRLGEIEGVNVGK